MFATGSNPYAANAKWLVLLAPFRTLALSGAYLTPFFIEKGLSLTEIFVLQAIFSLTAVVWEIPSGYIADRFGRARSVKLYAPLAAISLVVYGLAEGYWLFVVCEVVLAIAVGLVSGADEALLYDSLQADKSLSSTGLKQAFESQRRHIKTAGFAAIAAAAPLAYVLATYVSISATIIVDGLLVAGGGFFAWRLVEAPHTSHDLEEEIGSAIDAVKRLARNTEARWLLALGATLSGATYVAAWASVPYYQSIGIPLGLFGALYAIRSLLKAVLTYRYSGESNADGFWLKNLVRRKYRPQYPAQQSMSAYAVLAGAPYVAMAAGQPWLLWALGGHDVVHALHDDPIQSRLNAVMTAHRATLNSVVKMAHRTAYAVAGVLAGLLLDHAGLQWGFAILGVAFSTLALAVLLRLDKLGTFRERR